MVTSHAYKLQTRRLSAIINEQYFVLRAHNRIKRGGGKTKFPSTRHTQNKYPIKRRYLIFLNTFMLLFNKYSTNHDATRRRSKVCSFAHKKDDLTSQVQRDHFISFFLLFSLGMSRLVKLLRNIKVIMLRMNEVNETKYYNLMSSQYILRIPLLFSISFSHPPSQQIKWEYNHHILF